MKNIDSDLIRGNIDTIILKTMLDGDKYGLDIIKEVESRSNGTYELKQPTLYSCLKRLENQQLISSYWLDSDIGGRRHYYKLTEKGHETLAKKQEEWAKSKFIIDNLLSNYNYEEYRLVKKDDYDKIIEGKQFVYETPQSPAQNNTEQIEEPFEATSEGDEDYEQVNSESDISEFNELESSSEQENFHDSEESSENNEFPTPAESEFDFNYGYNETAEEKPEPAEDEPEDDNSSYGISLDESSERVNPLEPSTKRLYYVDIDDDEPAENATSEESDEFEQEEFSFDAQSSEELEEDLNESETTENPEAFNEEPEEFSFEDAEQAAEDIQYFAQSENVSHEDVPEVKPEEDQSSFESNILARLRAQDDEQINTYYGDQKSYVNHLNKTDELENVNVVQPSLLDEKDASLVEEVDESLNEFADIMERLNNFTMLSDENKTPEEVEEESEPEEAELPTSFEEVVEDDNLILNDASEIEYNDEFTEELNALGANKNNGFFNSYDNPDYEISKVKETKPASNNFDYDFNQTDSSDASFEEESTFEDESSDNEVFNYTFANSQNETQETYSQGYSEIQETSQTNLYDLDQIISNNASNYSNQYMHQENDTFTSFVPKYTSESYKQKLSNLSAYSKISEDETEKTINEDALNKAKDIEALRNEFEQEGIKIREFKKYHSSEQSEKTYLLSTKIKFINSLILLFGYVFVLSAVYIILNNTGFKNTYGFSFKWFLFGFIPFGIYAGYHTVMYLINPYKKIPAKLAPRILIFIAIIMTIQLLLITYCINLQLGFYSFTQAQYNHLLWVIPTVISFAPIFANISYITLFYSKNFNV